MARGDVVSGIATVPPGARLTFQPAAGAEVMITEVGSGSWVGTTPNGTPDIRVELTDGTMKSRIRAEAQATHWSGGTLKLFVTNSLYLSILNQSPTSGIAYCGIQTK